MVVVREEFFSLFFINKMQFFCKDWVIYNKQKSFFKKGHVWQKLIFS
jgi:hypothetical protein